MNIYCIRYYEDIRIFTFTNTSQSNEKGVTAKTATPLSIWRAMPDETGHYYSCYSGLQPISPERMPSEDAIICKDFSPDQWTRNKC